jgi:hypothetical protein
VVHILKGGNLRAFEELNMQRAFLAGLTILGLCLGASGCTTLADVSSGHVGCPPDQVVISNKRTRWQRRTWTAECHGRRYFCASTSTSSINGATDTDVSCAPEGQGGETPVASPAPAATTTTAPAAPAPEPRITRTTRDGQPLLRAELDVPNAEIELIAAPTREPDQAAMTLLISAQPSHSDCPAGLLMDGTVHTLALHHHEALGTREKVSYIVPMTALRQWAEAERVVGRICQDSLDFGAEHAATIRALLVRFDEELAWQSAQSPESAPAASPAGDQDSAVGVQD